MAEFPELLFRRRAVDVDFSIDVGVVIAYIRMYPISIPYNGAIKVVPDSVVHSSGFMIEAVRFVWYRRLYRLTVYTYAIFLFMGSCTDAPVKT